MTLNPVLSAIITMVAVARNRAVVKRTLSPILARDDDHLLLDIGLTRYDADALIRDPGAIDNQSQLRMQAAAGTLCRSM